MEVNRFESFNQYCGPAVLSIFTGCNTDDCADEISKVNGQHNIKGVYPNDLIRAGRNMGLEFGEAIAFEGRSIFWMASALVRMPPAQYLVTIPKHYVALEVRNGSVFICDNHTKTELELQNSARLSQKVEHVWKVTKVKEYIRPYPVKTEYAAERQGMNVELRCIQTLSDGGVKIHPLGKFRIMNDDSIKALAFELMKLD